MRLNGTKLLNIRYKLDLRVHQFAELCNVCPRTMTRLVKGERVHPETYRDIIQALVKYEFIPIEEVEVLLKQWCVEWLASQEILDFLEELGMNLTELILRTRQEYAMQAPDDVKLMKLRFDRPKRKKQTRKKRSKQADEESSEQAPNEATPQLPEEAKDEPETQKEKSNENQTDKKETDKKKKKNDAQRGPDSPDDKDTDEPDGDLQPLA